MALQMDTAYVYWTERFHKKTTWKSANSENKVHAYWYNIDTNNQS